MDITMVAHDGIVVLHAVAHGCSTSRTVHCVYSSVVVVVVIFIYIPR